MSANKSTPNKNDRGSQKQPLSQNQKKGQTLGAQHSSHGESGIEKKNLKPSSDKSASQRK